MKDWKIKRLLDGRRVMPHIFLDESGQFAKNSKENYFVIGSFTVGEPRRTNKGFAAWFKKKYPKKIRHQAEIKFSDTGISEKLRLRTLQHIAKMDVRINYAYFVRSNIPDTYWHKGQLKGGLLYANIVAETLEMYLPTTDLDFRVFCDKRHLNGITVEEFKKIITARLLPQLPGSALVRIEMLDSAANRNIQIADWIAGALFRKLEGESGGREYFQILQHNILHAQGKEMFKKSIIGYEK